MRRLDIFTHLIQFFPDTMKNVVGLRTAELYLQFGLLVSPQEALQSGLVDQLAAEDKVEQEAFSMLQVNTS